MSLRLSICALSLFAISNLSLAAVHRGLVNNADATNISFAVGVSHGLPGIDIDVNNIVAMGADPAFKFQPTTLMESAGTVEGIRKGLTAQSGQVGPGGTFLFYFSGHGNVGIIHAQDRTMHIREIRDAIVEGRKGKGPVERLVLIFDSCFSGSLLDPVRRYLRLPEFTNDREASEAYAQRVVREMTRDLRNADEYWKNLIVFASSRGDETSLAGDDGSVFTNAFKKAFQETMTANASLGEFIRKTQTYTVGHHPVARLVPSTLENEPMRP